MNKEQLLGSQTAKNGFRDEEDIVKKFNQWSRDEDAQKWLLLMEYRLEEIEFVKAVKISGYKTDVQVQVTIKLKTAIDCQNLQVKLVSNLKGFNQIDKRWVDKYVDMWNIPTNICYILKRYTGEVMPTVPYHRDKRRMFADEFEAEEQDLILQWMESNKSFIVSDILKGRGRFSAEWMLVVKKVAENFYWVLKPMNYCLNYFGNGKVEITKKGNFKIGKITMQRK